MFDRWVLRKTNVVITAVFIVSLIENVLSGPILPAHSKNIRFVNRCLDISVFMPVACLAPEFGPSVKSEEGRR
jgi:hypothetical protein